jgi:hypothetical protein
VNLSWVDNSTNETGFKIARSTDGTTFTQIATVGAGITAYISSGLTTGRTYFYRINAYNVAGNSAYSNTATVGLTPPVAPSNLAASLSANRRQVNLVWTDRSNNETGFQVERSTTAIPFTVIATTAANVRTYSDSTVTRGQRYYYRVRAKNNIGLLGSSNLVTVTP